MESIVCKGLVIRQTNYAEADRILTIFTQELGIVRAMAKGARKYRSHQGAAAQLLCYGQFTLYQGKNMYTMRGASPIENFFGISSSVEKLALATYLCDITQTFVAEANREPEILRLLLNTLYLLANKDRPLPLIKAVYELRLLALSGFGVEATHCVGCGAENELIGVSLEAGGAVCRQCASSIRDMKSLSGGTLQAIEFALHQPVQKIYSFEVTESVLTQMADFAELFVLSRAERDFYSLSYYHNVAEPDKQ